MDRGARAIGEGLPSNHALATLDLEHNSIKDEGAKAIAKGLRGNGALTTLKLAHNGISNETLAEAFAALATTPEVSQAATPADAPRARAADEDEEEIEEISFDDDHAAEAEAAAEAAAEARERAAASAERAETAANDDDDTAGSASGRRAGGAGGCVDRGPWECNEDNCPSPKLGCADLVSLGVCSLRFEDVWEHGPPEGTAGRRIADECPRACGKCDRDEL